MLGKDQSPPAFSVPKQPRGVQVRKDRDLANVGPFNYTQTFADKKAEPKFSMGAKLDSSLVPKNSAFGPAPVAYEPDFKPTRTKAP